MNRSFEHLEPRQMLTAHPVAHLPALVHHAPIAAPAVIVGGIGGSGSPTAPSRAGIAPWRPPGMVAVPYSVPSLPSRVVVTI